MDRIKTALDVFIEQQIKICKLQDKSIKLFEQDPRYTLHSTIVQLFELTKELNETVKNNLNLIPAVTLIVAATGSETLRDDVGEMIINLKLLEFQTNILLSDFSKRLKPDDME